MTNLDSVLKSSDTILPIKVHNRSQPKSKLWFFQQSCIDVGVVPKRRLSSEELMLSNCGAGEDS